MTVATINAVTTTATNTEALSTANTTFSLGTLAVGGCVIVVCATRSATVSITALSGGGVTEWELIGTFTFTVPQAQIFSVFAGRVTATGGGTVTATGSASLAAISGSFGWQSLTTSGQSAGTSWVVESSGFSNNTASSANITMPTLVPAAAGRAYIGYGDAGGTATNTGITAGYTGTIETTASSGLNQWISNLSVSTSQSPIGKQGTSTTSGAMGLLIYATNADTTPATTLNIGATGGQNHFKLQTAFLGYSTSTEIIQADIINGWNTDPQFVALPNGAVQFSVAAGAPSTSGPGAGNYPRSELREENPDGVTDMAFNALSGTHWIRGRTKVTSLPAGTGSPPRQRSTLCQLHDGATGVGEVLKFYIQESGAGLPELRLSVWDSGSGMPKYNLNYAVGDVFDWKLLVDNTVSSGYWAVFFQDLGTPVYTSLDYAADGFTNVFSGLSEYYFKCGSYPTVNATQVDAAALSTVELSYVQHWHTGWATPSPAITLPKTFQFAPMFG